jgi:hypothetical protein
MLAALHVADDPEEFLRLQVALAASTSDAC